MVAPIAAKIIKGIRTGSEWMKEELPAAATLPIPSATFSEFDAMENTQMAWMTAAAKEGTIRWVVRESLPASSDGTPASPWDCSDSRKEGMARSFRIRRLVFQTKRFDESGDQMVAIQAWIAETQQSDAKARRSVRCSQRRQHRCAIL